MTLENAISMGPVKEKLRKLKDYLPNQPSCVYEFGTFLAERLNPQLVPTGFIIAVDWALSDLQKGVDGVRQPIRSNLVGYPSSTYAALRMCVPDIAKAVCPEDFAKGVIDEA